MTCKIEDNECIGISTIIKGATFGEYRALSPLLPGAWRKGQISGYGSINGEPHAFLLTPARRRTSRTDVLQR
jgi:hypothetical protein